MDLSSFRSLLSAAEPPAGIGDGLLALWWDARGDWHAAHEVAQAMDDGTGAWIHAYLHRKEGDEGNAAYWYRRAGRRFCRAELASEWQQIAAALTEG